MIYIANILTFLFSSEYAQELVNIIIMLMY